MASPEESCLVYRESNGELGPIYELDRSTVFQLGRSPTPQSNSRECSPPWAANCAALSRLHLRFEYERGVWQLENLNAHPDGTKVCHQVLGKGERRPLAEGDWIEVAGQHRLEFGRRSQLAKRLPSAAAIRIRYDCLIAGSAPWNRQETTVPRELGGGQDGLSPGFRELQRHLWLSIRPGESADGIILQGLASLGYQPHSAICRFHWSGGRPQKCEQLSQAADLPSQWLLDVFQLPEIWERLSARRAVLIDDWRPVGRPAGSRTVLGVIPADESLTDARCLVVQHPELTGWDIHQLATAWPLLAIHSRPEAVRPSFQIIGDSPAWNAMMRTLSQYAVSALTVLITGESGTGKEVLARRIHALSPRADHPFLAVNCAAVPRDLWEAQFFGHEIGAFTGAIRRTPGHFGAASGGTLFLDEVGEIDLGSQAKLLRALEMKEVTPVGATRVIPVDVRVVAATNRNLGEAVRKGQFRADLLQRLNVLPLEVPPLRERDADVELLARYFLAEMGAANRMIQASAVQQLHAIKQFANARTLKSIVERTVILSPPGSAIERWIQVAADRPFDEPSQPASPMGAYPDELEPRWKSPPLWPAHLTTIFRRILGVDSQVDRKLLCELLVVVHAIQSARGHKGKACQSLQRNRQWMSRRYSAEAPPELFETYNQAIAACDQEQRRLLAPLAEYFPQFVAAATQRPQSHGSPPDSACRPCG